MERYHGGSNVCEFKFKYVQCENVKIIGGVIQRTIGAKRTETDFDNKQITQITSWDNVHLNEGGQMLPG